MAIRPLFTPINHEKGFIREIPIEFRWYAGMSVSQKQKNIVSLHTAAKKQGVHPLLEVSSKSVSNLGRQLSSFNLMFRYNNGELLCVESAFQGSKVFQFGGPYEDLYYQPGKKAKTDRRIKNSGQLLFFQFFETQWPLQPTTAFYDWLYLNALFQNRELANQLLNYQGFTDIEFNPQKSVNCQARSCALYVSLAQGNLISEALKEKEVFLGILTKGVNKQLGLL